jgi:ABC-type sugar transport system substrate-binding protein
MKWSIRLGMGAAMMAVALVTAVSALAADEIGESSPILSNPNQQAITRGEQLAAKTFGWKVKTIDANLSPDKQVSDVDTLVNLGVKGLITWTLDAGAAGAAYKRATDKGIPVIDYGSTSNVTSAVFDERGYKCTAGVKAAGWIAKRS